MGWLNKLGKIALSAAPYVAAPFTGGLSLAATGLTNKAVQNWSAKDAAKREAKGLAPSKFDSVLGKVNAGAGLASSFMPTGALGSVGALSKAVGGASKAAKVANQVGRGASAALGGSYNGTSPNPTQVGNDMPSQGGITGNMGRSRGIDWEGMINQGIGMAGDMYANRGQSADPYTESGARGLGPSGARPDSAVPRGQGGVMPRGGFSYQDNPGNQYDQNNPNLAMSLFQGKQEAIRNQPFRKGYEINYGTTEEPQRRGIGPIYPYQDWSTPKRAKKQQVAS